MRLIYACEVAEKIRQALELYKAGYLSYEEHGMLMEMIDCAIAAIKDTPTADVQEVKHGRWVYNTADRMFYCSKCMNMAIRNDYPFCMWCGAKMDGESE